MNVALLCPSLSRASGGVFETVREVARQIALAKSTSVSAFGLLDDSWELDRSRWGSISANCFDSFGPRVFGFSPALRNAVRTAHADILHLHALWMYTSMVALDWARRTHRPLVVSPHNMLAPWSLSNARWKKVIASTLYERRMLKKASCLHALTRHELRDIRAHGLTQPVAVIPNGVHVPVLAPKHRDDRYVLYLGRLHPVKGIRELIEAWGMVPQSLRAGWRLVIAGWDDGGHEVVLKQNAAAIDLPETITFPGPQYGRAKSELLSGASAFVLPSFTEGLPMAVLEAWAYSLPVLLSNESNLTEGVERKAAIPIDPNATSVARGLAELFRLSDDERTYMGLNGRKLVESEFNWDKIGQQFIAVYNWLGGAGDAPSCVEFN